MENHTPTKTPITILQELTVKHNDTPRYCISEADLCGVFCCDLEVLSIKCSASGKSKKEAKHAAAKNALTKLAGLNIHPISGDQGDFVAVLRDRCNELCISEAVFNYTGECGPPHLRLFTVQCVTEHYTCEATSNSKKKSKQLAAEAAIEKLATLKTHFSMPIVLTSEDLKNKNAEAEKNYVALTSQEKTVVLNPKLQIKDWIYSWRTFDEIKKNAVLDKINEATITSETAVMLVESLFKILNLDFEWGTMRNCDPLKHIVTIMAYGVTPPLALASVGNSYRESKYKTAIETIEYMKLMLNM